jgi:hypothetical protein
MIFFVKAFKIKKIVKKYSLFPKGMLPFGDFSSQKQN